MEYRIEQETTLLDALEKCYPDSTRNTLRAMVRDGRVFLDDKLVTSASTPLAPGQELRIGQRQQKKVGPLKVVYEDRDLIVIDKPTGLLSVATNFDSKNTAHAILKKQYSPKKIFVVHRLDQDTSGLMIFGLSEEAYEDLKAKLAAHDMQRIYYGIVEGKLTGKGTWTSYLSEDNNYLVHSSDDPNSGERAVTHYEAVLHRKEVTLVRFQLETGKKNQIRVHTAEAGFPIYGDEKYGAVKPYARRLYLHAFELRFRHPTTNKELCFTSPLPKEFLHTLSLPKFP